ncbi:MAG: hypothetical protein RIS70_2360, partial [Planctomycetota bacterium]
MHSLEKVPSFRDTHVFPERDAGSIQNVCVLELDATADTHPELAGCTVWRRSLHSETHTFYPLITPA